TTRTFLICEKPRVILFRRHRRPAEVSSPLPPSPSRVGNLLDRRRAMRFASHILAFLAASAISVLTLGATIA
ncbi:MAG: hypothetical protein ACTHKM_01860, partial [Tsuneonella sp.]